ncbi:TPA: hypothetical protein PL523_004354 [Cronobacter turicensis]|nr:hypothetical protein [Cronobacter turicensis]HDI3035710.1 hypothetical protein [Cronobacter turicensis]
MGETLTETRRRRLVNIKLNATKGRTGGHIQLVKIGDVLFPVELSEELLTDTLIEEFEAKIYATSRRQEAENIISAQYSDCMEVRRLTPHGVEFMNGVVEVIARQKLREKGLTGRAR